MAKKKRSIARWLMGAIAIVLCLCMSVSSFAATEDGDDVYITASRFSHYPNGDGSYAYWSVISSGNEYIAACLNASKDGLVGTYTAHEYDNDVLKAILLLLPGNALYEAAVETGDIYNIFSEGLSEDEHYMWIHLAASAYFSNDYGDSYFEGATQGSANLTDDQINFVNNLIALATRISTIGVYWGVNLADYTLYFAEAASSSTQNYAWVEYTPTGNLTLSKSSSLSYTTGLNTYSLSGAMYGVYSTRAQAQAAVGSGAWTGDEVAKLITTSSGDSNTVELDSGTYYVAEVKASEGYLVDTTVYTVTVSARQTTTVSSVEEPYYDPSVLFVEKGISNSSITSDLQGDITSLAGVQFRVDYYDAIYSSVSQAQAATPKTSAIFETNSNGMLYLDADYLVSGSWSYNDGESDLVFPIGTYVITEVGSIDGLLVTYADSSAYTITVSGLTVLDGALFSSGITGSGDSLLGVVENDIYYGGIIIGKTDRDSGEYAEEGDATLEGAVFEVINRSANAVYVEGEWYDVGDVIMTITTEEMIYNGETVFAATTGEDILPYGTYELREISSTTGYLYDSVSQAYSVTVSIREDGEMVEILDEEDAISNQVIRGGITIGKVDRTTGSYISQGDAYLEGAEFEIVNKSENPVYVDGTWYDVGEVVMTIEVEEMTHDGKTIYAATTGEYALPYGTYEIYEVSSGVGYLFDEESAAYNLTFTIREDGQMVEVIDESEVVSNQVIMGGIIIGKIDRETGQYVELGDATLEGATFEVVNDSETSVYVYGTWYEVGEVIMTITTQEMEYNGETIYAATTGENVLPYGTYILTEVGTSEGYLFDSTSKAYSVTVSVREDGEMVEVIEEDETVANQVMREDWHFQKKAEDTMERMAQVAFLVTSTTTGEQHIIVTDENGTWGSSFTAHTNNTNANDPTSPNSNGAVAIDEDGNWYVVDSSLLDCDAGVWFTGLSDDMVEWNDDGVSYQVNGETVYVDDSLRSFPYDTYYVQELRCDANEGYDLVSFTVTLRRYTSDHDGDGLDIDYGTIDDSLTPVVYMDTTLTYNNTYNVVPAAENTRIEDEVLYTNVTIGEEYTIKGELHAINAEGVDEGVIATTEKTFTSTVGWGMQTNTFTVDTSDYGGYSLVAFEYIYDADGNLLASHEDLEDADQTVIVPVIATVLNGDAYDMSNAAAEMISLVDEVYYSNIEAGRYYILTGTLMDKETGEAVVDENGDEVTAQAAFYAYTSSGMTEVTFEFNNPDVAGTTAVAFEQLTIQSLPGVVFAVHEDLDDEAQTVYFPSISTHLKEIEITATEDTISTEDDDISIDEGAAEVEDIDGIETDVETDIETEVETDEVIETEDEAIEVDIHEVAVPEDGIVTLVDEVTYENLVAGYEYTVEGCIHIRVENEDGTISDGGELTDADGNAITATTTFVAEGTSGAVYLTFEFDASDLVGQSVIAYEYLYLEDELLATHEDIDDPEQTVWFSSISTVASDGYTEAHIGLYSGTYVLVDEINYAGLIPGEEYTVVGYIHVRETDEDGNVVDGGVLLDINGNEVTAETTFIAEASSGTTYVTFEFEVEEGSLTGKTLTMYEYLYRDGVLIVEDADILNDSETIWFMSMSTLLTGADGESKDVVADEIDLIDIITYENLVPNLEYTVRSWLVDGEGNVLTDTIETTFVPEESEGEIEVVLSIDATEMADGDVIIAFEQILYNGEVVGSHEDLEDVDQTVTVSVDSETPATCKESGVCTTYVNLKTGGNSYATVVAILAAVLAGFGAIYVVVKRRRI